MWNFTEAMKMGKKPIITIDGPSGSGKSTVSILLAKTLGYEYLDTGALYRAAAYKIRATGIALDDIDAISEALHGIELSFLMREDGLHVILNGEDITGSIRTPEIDILASKVSAISAVREALLGIQKGYEERGGAVLEGRDLGTVVFPDAEIKFFLLASLEERGRRRFLQFGKDTKGNCVRKVAKALEERDRQDRERKISPMKAAPDAITIDTTSLGIEEVIEKMLGHISRKVVDVVE